MSEIKNRHTLLTGCFRYSVTVGVYLLGFRFPGNKSKMFIYGSTAERFKLRPRGGTFLLRSAGLDTGPGDTPALTGKTHL